MKYEIFMCINYFRIYGGLKVGEYFFYQIDVFTDLLLNKHHLKAGLTRKRTHNGKYAAFQPKASRRDGRLR